MKKTITGVLTTVVLGVVLSSQAVAAPSSSPDTLEKRGCCSHHDGVCGCSSGRTTCCDGSTSPSCTC